MSFLVVWTVFSTSPLACGYFGLLVLWLKSHNFANCSNSDDRKFGALSDVSNFGIPWRLNWLFNFTMKADDVNESSLSSSKNRL